MKRLTWRLRVLPTAEGLAMLVEQGIVTKEEARFILLGEAGEKKEDK
jgi:hypothetical protein